ncbi:amino acid racemase [Paraburkholderia xenovorans]|uniref:aspartate/glutamate racemase family protein n=1 Tax=Paraburkholderia xenovorans TaxID=36873 RepID=UPI0038BB678E
MSTAKAMKKIGLIGGLSYPSTITYYELVNRLGNRYLGAACSPRIVMESLNFQTIADGLRIGDRRAVQEELCTAASRLADAGAELIAMCCNTVHKFASEVEASTEVPIVNICRSTAGYASLAGFRHVGLMGSAYSMEESFYHGEFARHGIRASIPSPAGRRFIQHAIETELSVGRISDATRERFLSIAEELIEQGAQALVLACTEIPLVLRPHDVDVPVIDTVRVHVDSILQAATETPFFTETSCEPII